MLKAWSGNAFGREEVCPDGRGSRGVTMDDQENGDGKANRWEPAIGAMLGGALFGPIGLGLGYALRKLWSSSKGNT